MHPHSADVFVDAYLARHAGPSVASPRPAWQKPWLLALLAAAISLLAGVLWRSLDLPAGPALVLPGIAVAGALPVYLCARLLHQRKRLTHARGEVALLRQLCSLWAQSEGACLKELDAHGRLLAMSERGRQLMDVCDFDALRGSDWLGIWPGEAAATARDAFARALAGEPARFSGFCPTLAGVAKWWDVLIMPLPGAGEATSMLVLSWDVTEVRQRACQLQTTNDELTTLLEHLDDGFCRLDRSWRLVELNGRAVALLQRPRSELLGTLLWDLLPQARGAELGVALQEVMDLGIARRIETFSPQYQGWYRIHAYPHADGLYLFFSDISRDVASAQTAQAVQARLRLSQQVGLFGDWQFDLTSQRLDLSDQALQLLGMPSGAAAGEALLERLHPQDRLGFVAAMLDLAEGQAGFDARVRLSGTAAEDWRHFHFAGTVIRTKAYPAGLLVGCLQDVTEQQRREARLEDAEAFTRGIIDALPLAIGVIDGNGRLITANQVWMAGGNAPAALSGCKSLDYLARCRAATGDGLDAGARLADGIEALLAGIGDPFVFSYEHGCGAQRRVYQSSALLMSTLTRRVLVVHELLTGESRNSEGATLTPA